MNRRWGDPVAAPEPAVVDRCAGCRFIRAEGCGLGMVARGCGLFAMDNRPDWLREMWNERPNEAPNFNGVATSN